MARTVAGAAVVGTLGATSLVIGTFAGPATAALSGLTEFEIDGDTAVGAGQDWSSIPAAAPNLRDDPWRTLEVCDDNPVFVDDNGTPDDPSDDNYVTEDTTRVVQGTKIDDLDLDAPLVNSGNVPRKTDLCAVYRSWELVFVPTADLNDDPDAGQYQFIFYGAWSRPNVNGEIDVLFPLLGNNADSTADDLIISYDFVDSSDTTNVELLAFNDVNGSWEPITLPAGTFEAVTTRGVEVHPEDETKALTFGEFAINLTLAGILPEDGPCVSLTSGDPMSRTGNSANSTLEDIVEAAPVLLTNCGSLTVSKQTVPAVPAGTPSFDILTNQLDGAVVQPGGAVEIVDALIVPTDPTETYVEMLISPDYTVTETNLPDGWTEQSLVCDSYDPIAGVDVTRTLWSGSAGPDSAFPIAPGVEATCVIVNGGPPTLTVTKTTVGGAGGPFTFTVSDAGGDRSLTVTTTAADTPTLVDQGTIELAPGAVSLTETAMPAGFFAGDLTCTLTTADGAATQLSGIATAAGDPTGVDAQVAPGDVIVCDQVDLSAASISVEKLVDPPDATGWSFDFTISPVPSGETGTKAATAASPIVGWGNLQPGVDYSISEGTLDGYVNGTFACDNGQPGTSGPVVTPGAGEAISCTANNTELANVSVTKTVDGVATDWSFDFTISPVPDGETATKAATAATPTVSWDGLVPGTDYTITETPVVGYITGTLTCGGTDATGTSSFAPTAGQDVSCTITNTELANVSVTKTVAPAETGWSFDFTISPVPDGETATKTATAATPTVSWDGLVPGTDYTVTEVADSDLVIGAMACTGGTTAAGTSTFAPTAGQDVSCTITNTRIADISVVKTSSRSSVLPGDSVTWTIQVTNNGPSTALDVVLTDAIPAALTLDSIEAPASWNCGATVLGSPGTVSCSKPDMIPGEIWTFEVATTVSATAAAGVAISNVAVVTTTTDETTTDNNSDDAAIDVDQIVILPPTGGRIQTGLTIGGLMMAAGLLLVTTPRRRRPA